MSPNQQDDLTFTSKYPVKRSDPMTNNNVPNENRTVARHIARHGTFGGGLTNYVNYRNNDKHLSTDINYFQVDMQDI